MTIDAQVKVKLTPIMTTANFALWMTHNMGEVYSTERAREWLRARGALVDFGNGRYCTTIERLATVLPQFLTEAQLMEARGEEWEP